MHLPFCPYDISKHLSQEHHPAAKSWCSSPSTPLGKSQKQNGAVALGPAMRQRQSTVLHSSRTTSQTGANVSPPGHLQWGCCRGRMGWRPLQPSLQVTKTQEVGTEVAGSASSQACSCKLQPDEASTVQVFQVFQGKVTPICAINYCM